MRKIQLGSISSGTLRTEDLLDAVIGESDYLFGSDYLDTHADSNDFIVKPLLTAKAVTDYDSEDAGDALEELIDALNQYAPAHTHLGTHEDDGADWRTSGFTLRLGWWPTDFKDCHTVSIDQGKNGESTFVDTDCNLYVEINDHGNTTVKELGGAIIWDCV